MATCSATTVKGTPCRRDAMKGSTLCAVHLHARPNPTALLTDAIADRLVALLRAGNYDAVAARAAGINERTLRGWLERGRSGRPADEPYRALAARVALARAEGEAVHVARVAKAAEDDWKASAWYLERAFPERWARPSPRPFAPRVEEEGGLVPPPSPGVFDEIDELAKKRASRTG